MNCVNYLGVRTHCRKIFLVRYTDGSGGESVTVRRCINTFPKWWSNIIVSELDIKKIDWETIDEVENAPQNKAEAVKTLRRDHV